MINPIDKVFNILVDYFNPIFYKIGFTPNILTTFSLLFGLISMYYFYFDKNILAACLFIINYFFDYADGRFARKYNMATKFGDIYDHVSDWITILLLLIIMYQKNSVLLLKLTPLALILLLLNLIDLGCSQKKRVGESKSSTIGFTTKLCVNQRISNIAKFFNTTFTVVLIFFVIIFYK